MSLQQIRDTWVQQRQRNRFFMQALSVISLNIEHDCHIPEVLAFLSNRQPAVVMLQEIFKVDLPFFENALKMHSVFTGLSYLSSSNNRGIQELGIATLSNLPMTHNTIHYYRGSPDHLPHIHDGEAAKMARALLITELSLGSQHYCFVNTHFTWTPNGLPSDQQYIDYDKMLKKLESIPEFVLCGDFNAPRGTAIFDQLSLRFKDNIPMNIKTTLDENFHRVPNLHLVVDGLFTTPAYEAHHVEVISGLSDHCAIAFEAICKT